MFMKKVRKSIVNIKCTSHSWLKVDIVYTQVSVVSAGQATGKDSYIHVDFFNTFDASRD